MTPKIWKAYLREEDEIMIKEMQLKTKRGLVIGSDMLIKKAGKRELSPLTLNNVGSVVRLGNLSQKRDFLKTNGSNHILKDRKLSFYWSEPFNRVAKIAPVLPARLAAKPRAGRRTKKWRGRWDLYVLFA